MMAERRLTLICHLSVDDSSRVAAGVTAGPCQGSEVGLVVASRQQLSSIKDDLVDNGDVAVSRRLSDLS